METEAKIAMDAWRAAARLFCHSKSDTERRGRAKIVDLLADEVRSLTGRTPIVSVDLDA